jgi:non-specific serine/threonine protein kinase
LGAFPDGVWFVELAPLTNPALVPQAVATALRMAANPMLPLSAQLADELRAKQVLLILDNCEHLIDASAQLADELLRACPHLRILASSREALDMEGEAIYRVPSLSCPTLDPQLLISHLMQFEAVRLFVERALLVQSNFSVTMANALTVIQICQRLDGIPLALELAAAQLKALAVEQIAAQLDDRFNLLAGGKRTSLPRQQTLRAAIDWSYNLLSASERALFRYLSVFAGSWTLDTAEWVCADDDTETSGRLVSADILGLLTQLVNKSLVVNNEQGNEARYHFLETIRQYARESLLEAGEEVRLRDRHLECFVRLAETAEPQLRTTQITTWLTRLESELDNVRTALDWAAQQARCEQGLRLAAALEYFWAIRDHQAEGGETLRRLLAHPSAAAPTLVRAKALNILSLLRIRVADYAQAETAAHEALAIGRALNDTPTIALTLFALGWRSILQGHYHEAQSLLEQSRSLFRASGSQLHGLRPLLFLGVAAMWLGDYVRAQAVFAELATLEQASGDKSLLSTAIRFWGFALFYQHDYAGASAKFRESLMPNLAFKDTTGITPCLIGYAALAMAYEQFERAVQLLSVVEALVASTHVRLMPYDHTQSTQYITALRAQLSEADFNAAWEAGKKMTLDEAIALALNS